MTEKLFYDERTETKPQKLICPACRRDDTYPIRWIVRTKKKQLPRGVSDEDRARFAKAQSYMVRLDDMVAKAQSYMVRLDDMVACRKCRKRIELTGQSLAMVSDAGAAANDPNFDPDTFGNR